MKKLFGRDKPKMAKVTPASREPVGANSIDGVRPAPSHAMSMHITPVQYPESGHRGPPPPQTQASYVGHRPALPPFAPPPRSSSHGPDAAGTPESISRRSSEQDRWEVVSAFDRRADSPQPRPPAHGGSYSSLGSLPPGAAYPTHALPPHAPLPPRSSSPYSTSSQTYSRSGRDDRTTLKKKPPGAAPGAAVAALGILSALNPHAAASPPAPLQPSPPQQQQYWDDAGSERFVREERKEKRGFFHRERSPEKGKGKVRETEEEGITRMIGECSIANSLRRYSSFSCRMDRRKRHGGLGARARALRTRITKRSQR